MMIKYIYLTDQSRKLAERINESVTDHILMDIDNKYGNKKNKYGKGIKRGGRLISYRDFKKDSARIFAEADCLVFIMASGIVVRAIAGLLTDKFRDPAVLVVDELGINVISLLSGHMGGGNDFCRMIAARIGANPVITTATDINGKSAFDMLVKKMWANVDNIRDLSLKINSSLLRGGDNYIYIDPDYRDYFAEEELSGFKIIDSIGDLALIGLEGLDKNGLEDRSQIENIFDKTNVVSLSNKDNENKIVISDKSYICHYAEKHGLVLVIPRRNVLGIGCRKDIDSSLFEGQVLEYLSGYDIDVRSIGRVASIDLKKDETCIGDFCAKYGIESDFFAPHILANYEDRYEKSDFVKRTIGVYSVAQPACHILSGGRLLGQMYRGKGITLALGRR